MDSDLMNLAANLNKKTKNIVGESFTVEDKDYFKKAYEYLKSNNQDTTRLEERLKTLTMIKNQEMFYSLGSRYDERKNELTYTDEQDLYHETFHIATNGILMRKDKQILGTGLNEGITDMLAKRVNPNVTNSYKVERIIAEALEKAYGKEVFNPYFKGSGQDFINQFDSDLMEDMLMDIDNYSMIMSNFWYRVSNLSYDKYQEEKEKASPKVSAAFEDIMYDMSELMSDIKPEKLEEVVSLIENKLNSEDLSEIEGMINPNDNKINLKEIFNIEQEQKRY